MEDFCLLFMDTPFNNKIRRNMGYYPNQDEIRERIKENEMYGEFLLERDEIMRHKWYMSEKAGYDVGFDAAHIDWHKKHRSKYKEQRDVQNRTEKAAQGAF